MAEAVSVCPAGTQWANFSVSWANFSVSALTGSALAASVMATALARMNFV